MRGACWSIAWLIGLGCTVWAFGALQYDFPIWKTPVAWAFASTVLAAVVFLRSPWQKLGATFFAFALVLVWWLTLKPTSEADWQPDVAQVAWAEIHGDEVTLHNVRNCDYRTKADFIPHWETRTVRISQITGIDLAIDYWGSPLDRTSHRELSIRRRPAGLLLHRDAHETWSSLLRYRRPLPAV